MSGHTRCPLAVRHDGPAKSTSKNSKNKPRRAKNNNLKPQAVSTAEKGYEETPRAVTKENLCASSKRKLEAYRARQLKPQEGELANKNNEMFSSRIKSAL